MAANFMGSMYDVSLAQAANMIRLCGSTNTVLLQGHIGTGKSSMLKTLGKMLPTHRPVYFDCTTKDLGDITIPKLADMSGDDGECVRHVPNEELGVHLSGPVILMVDEYGKANPAVKNAMLRLMLERKIGGYALHKDSIVFATTNLGAEGVGDLLPAHARNRITVLRVRKPSVTEWIEDYAIDAGVNHVLIAWATENPNIFASFEDVAKPDDNEVIFHPQAPGRVSFVTPRTMALASFWMDSREHMSDHELTAALVGTLGHAAAGSLAAYVKVSDQMPKLQEIKDAPKTAKVPDNKTVVMMVVHRTLASIERNWTDAWMDYMVRLPMEAQAMFANAVRRSVDKKQTGGNKRLMEVNTNKKYMDWCLANNYMFAADKK
jgi:energy-coupling factor transporter ATP-binding protein EcfA2